MSIKSTIAAAAASPFLFAGAAFAGPYVNLEATGSYPDCAYTCGGLEAVVGYEGETPSGIGWYVSGGPTVTHTETAVEFGDVEFIGYVGGSYDKFYGELSAVTNEDLVDWGAKAAPAKRNGDAANAAIVDLDICILLFSQSIPCG